MSNCAIENGGLTPDVFCIQHDTNIVTDIVVHTKELCILNSQKTEYDVLEMFVYNSVMFHLNRLGMKPIDEYIVEFWTKSKVKSMDDCTSNCENVNNFHVDCDEALRVNYNTIKSPCFSIVSYFSSNHLPVVLTNITHEEYKFKLFENKNQLHLVFPEKNKQIVFDGKYFHGVCDMFNEITTVTDRYMIAINVWEHELINQSHYCSHNAITFPKDSVPPLFQFTEIPDTFVTVEYENILDFDFYNNLLYNPDLKLSDYIPSASLKNTVDELDVFKKNICVRKSLPKLDDSLCTQSNTSLTKHIIEVMNVTMNYTNRFLQRFKMPTVYNRSVCNWIIDEACKVGNERGWTTLRHDKYPTTDLPVEQIPSIFNFVVSSLAEIFTEINDVYCLNNQIQFNIKDLFIVKYEEDAQNELNEHTDGSFFTANILLSDPADFVGGGTLFEDGIHQKLNQGDCLIHCGQIKHQGVAITKGKRFLLVAFIGIISTATPSMLGCGVD